MDADFEKVVVTDDSPETTNVESLDSSSTPKTLLELSMDGGDPRWKETRIPFCRGTEYIDGKLAFMVDLEDVSYGIAIPFDDAVAIVKTIASKEDQEEPEVTYIDPDNYDADDDSQELMEIMAKQVKENLGEDLLLRKTPKVLTISGGLSAVTDNWEQKLVNKPVSVETLLEGADDDDDEDEFIGSFYEFMRKELGDEEFEKTMQEEMSEEDREFAKFFDVNYDDVGTAEELMANPEKIVEEAKAFHPNTDGVALKLIGFEFEDRSRSYQLVKLLKPYPLVGKRIIEDVEQQGLRFELLSPEEEKILIPKLEEFCREDLTKAGLSLIQDE